eukprot:TRINITY_DN6444_c0_g3_i1.p1 TRINITY_DN6444_c0_g3~~TRINITY_DN6444_c0_g3_i1.p1  ORF type:complete len:295 (+),score=82.56 TRINITY_DN6444_c0_g3_i1:57-941(+)
MSVSEVEDVIISLDEEDNAATVPVPKGRPRGKKAATSSTSEHASESPEASTSPKRKSAAKGSSPTKEDSDRTSRAKRKVTFADESDSEDGSDQDEDYFGGPATGHESEDEDGESSDASFEGSDDDHEVKRKAKGKGKGAAKGKAKDQKTPAKKAPARGSKTKTSTLPDSSPATKKTVREVKKAKGNTVEKHDDVVSDEREDSVKGSSPSIEVREVTPVYSNTKAKSTSVIAKSDVRPAAKARPSEPIVPSSSSPRSGLKAGNGTIEPVKLSGAPRPIRVGLSRRVLCMPLHPVS